jgi:hypothetical protein
MMVKSRSRWPWSKSVDRAVEVSTADLALSSQWCIDTCLVLRPSKSTPPAARDLKVFSAPLERGPAVTPALPIGSRSSASRCRPDG